MKNLIVITVTIIHVVTSVLLYNDFALTLDHVVESGMQSMYSMFSMQIH